MRMRALLRLMNIDYLIAKKWSGQNWTSRTGSAAPAIRLLVVSLIQRCPYFGLSFKRGSTGINDFPRECLDFPYLYTLKLINWGERERAPP